MKNSTGEDKFYRAVLDHVAPFIVWLLLLLLPLDPPTNYLVRTVTVAALVACLRPWKWYHLRFAWTTAVLALTVGMVAFVAWIAPETEWFAAHLPGLQRWYFRVSRLGDATSPRVVFDPTAWGPFFLAVRLLGATFVIAPVEELFWRGFFYRVTFRCDFLRVPLNPFSAWRYVLVAVLFGLEHRRWVVGAVAGALYTALMIRSNALWPAALAHATTNLMLGIYVMLTGSYHLW